MIRKYIILSRKGCKNKFNDRNRYLITYFYQDRGDKNESNDRNPCLRLQFYQKRR